MQIEFGGKRSRAFEFLRGRSMDEVEDGKIQIIGPDIDSVEEGAALPLGILINVAGRNFSEDFESVLERRIHEFLSCANGIFHMGQRAIAWVRVSKEAYQKGFRLKHFGEILIAKVHDEYAKIADKVQVTIITDEEKMKKPLEEAKKVYYERDERIGGMTDEDVDIYYSCILCQSYAPDHVCIVTPERLGLCGAYTWLDCKASHQLNPHGPNEPLKKGKILDPVKGQWEGVNEYLKIKSNGNLERFNAYSMLEDPMTSCGCFECIVAIIPEANGVMIVNREFTGMTPVGMTFSTMAGQVGGGIQTPGFIGIGKVYITSKKFISADGGMKRIVWMPAELKEEIKQRLQKRCEEIKESDFMEKIVTEKDATNSEELLEVLQKNNHPALSMEPMM